MKNNEYIIFTGGVKKFFDVEIRKSSEHVISIKFNDEVPAESTMRGFLWYYNDKALGDYTAFTTVYRYNADAGIYQLSNDGSVFVPTIKFTTTGGTLTGDLIQHISSYSDLVLPTPVSDDDWEFQNWNPSIPTSGVIHENESYQAVFEFIGTPPVPEPTVEERVADVETALCDLSEELSTSISDLETALCDLSTEGV